jgi:hypothetical protein
MFLHLLVSLAFGHNSIAYQESNGDWDTVPTCRGNTGTLYLNLIMDKDGDSRYVCTNRKMTHFGAVSYREVRVDPHATARMMPRCPVLDSHSRLRTQTSRKGNTFYVCASKRQEGLEPPLWYVSEDDPHRHHHFDDDGYCTCGRYNATWDMTPTHYHSYGHDGYCNSCDHYSSSHVVRVHSHSYHNGRCSCGHTRPTQHVHSDHCGHRTTPHHQHDYDGWGNCSCGHYDEHYNLWLLGAVMTIEAVDLSVDHQQSRVSHTHTWRNGKCTSCGKKKHVHTSHCDHPKKTHQRPRGH